MVMAKNMRATRAGVVVLSCSDPRLNPYQILGVDGVNVSKYCILIIALILEEPRKLIKF